MNHEQLAFFNQQLAGMLKAGLPLEGSLRQISSSMRRGELRDEIELLEKELAQGIPLEEALTRRRLPDLYKVMLSTGARSGDLPGVLTMAADHYSQTHANWMRLKGLMVYPGLVLFTALIVALLLGIIYSRLFTGSAEMLQTWGNILNVPLMLAGVWLPIGIIAIAFILYLVTISNRSWRHAARWKLPGFRESSLAQLASTIAMMLENGADLGSAIDVAQRSEGNNRVRRELAEWKQRLAEGARKFHEIARSGRVAPPLFVWLVAGAGENWARGFRRAAQAYDSRARYRTEMILYVALPIVILLLGLLITSETVPIAQGFVRLMHELGDTDGGGQ